jgi:hypothetical protein
VPVDTVNAIVPQLLKHGKLTRPGLGINILSDQIATQQKIDGVVILGVTPGGAADQAGIAGARQAPGGLALGDVIVKLDQTEIKRSGDLYRHSITTRWATGRVVLENEGNGEQSRSNLASTSFERLARAAAPDLHLPSWIELQPRPCRHAVRACGRSRRRRSSRTVGCPSAASAVAEAARRRGQRDIIYGADAKFHQLDIYTPVHRPGPWPVVFYVHGGAFHLLSKDTHWLMGLVFARFGYLVVNISYRLAPRHPYPAAIEDTCAAYRWLASRITQLGVDPDRVAVAGESAGGNLIALRSVSSGAPTTRVRCSAGLVPRAALPFCACSGLNRRFSGDAGTARWIDGIFVMFPRRTSMGIRPDRDRRPSSQIHCACSRPARGSRWNGAIWAQQASVRCLPSSRR